MSSPIIRGKYYQYKITSPLGVYLGLLQNVISDFQYNQNIATAFTQIQITVAQSADTASLPVSPILDEQSIGVTDETGAAVTDERVADLVGDGNSNALIANNNLITVYEYSNYYPNGLLVFSGYISKWKTVFGGDNNVIVTCISHGQDLGQHLVLATATTDQSNTNADSAHAFYVGGSSQPVIGQRFVTGAAVTNISAVDIKIDGPTGSQASINVAIYQEVNSNTPVGAVLLGSVNINPTGLTGAGDIVKASFSTPITLVAATAYWIEIMDNNAGAAGYNLMWECSGSSVYANGNAATYTPSSGGWINWLGNDFYFVTYYTGGILSVPYTNQDCTYVLNDFMTNYIADGGLCAKPAAGYVNTGVIMSYTFKTQTILQALATIMTFAPANWYWYVDPATNILQFAKASTTADITLIKGRHINEMEIEATKEGIKNKAYFTGGDDGSGTSTNIFVQQSVATSGNRIGLSLLSDNRVNSTSGGTATAKVLAAANLAQNASEIYLTTITIQDTTMDTNLLTLGKVIGFSGFGTFVDNLLLLVVGRNKQSDQVVLQVGSLPTRTTKQVAAIQAALAYLQTVANPSSAS